LLGTLLGLSLITLVGMGVRLVMMMTIQQRRERANRQINERLRTLIAAYKVIGGSFTGDLAVDPTHLRDLRKPGKVEAAVDAEGGLDVSSDAIGGSDRKRRIRDSVESTLSDIILLGTDEQVRLAAVAANELVAGRPIHLHDLVVSLRDFIRKALDLDPVPTGLAIPMQGPARPGSSAGRSKGDSSQGGGGKSGSGGGMGGMGMGTGGGAGMTSDPADADQHHH
jgi:uncharacterized membrane protein YgcG